MVSHSSYQGSRWRVKKSPCDGYLPVRRYKSCWPKNINWPSGPIFVLFDWPDRKYTGHGPAVTSNPAFKILNNGGSRLFGIRREKHGNTQLRKSTIMDCFLTISKKPKVAGNESAGFIKFSTNCTCHSANAILQPWISCHPGRNKYTFSFFRFIRFTFPLIHCPRISSDLVYSEFVMKNMAVPS
jgi:hypothetical protein